MPAHRRSSHRSDTSDVPPSPVESADIAFAPAVTPDSFQDIPPMVDYPNHESGMFSFDDGQGARRPTSRKKPANHIPRPPNAFILFRSAFIKSQHVSSGVETNHSTLSKIIGLTWQQLSNEERQKWHAKAKLAQEEHKRRYPQYSFRPIHNKARAPPGERRKLREVGPKDQKRCEKIAELLARGKKGEDLEMAIVEFDKHHVPEIVTRFEEPITASSFSSSSPVSRSSSSLSYRSQRSNTPASDSRPHTSHSTTPTGPPPPQAEYVPSSPTHSFDPHSFYSNPSPSFVGTFAFSVQHPSPTLPGEALVPVTNPSFNIPQDHDPSLLCGNPHQHYTDMEDWVRSCSPMSTNSTSSMPTTPAHINVPFPDQPAYAEPASYNNFVSEPGMVEFPQASTSYTSDFSEYRSYAGPAVLDPEPDYVVKTPGENVPSSFMQSPNVDECQVQTPMAREDIDFSLFMASLNPPYSI